MRPSANVQVGEWGGLMKRILVVIDKLLFRVGLESLLAHETDLLVKSIAYKNPKALNEEINSFEPHVILIDENLKPATHLNPLEILWGCSNISILVVNTQENRVQVYEKQEIRISGPQDLMNAIRG